MGCVLWVQTHILSQPLHCSMLNHVTLNNVILHDQPWISPWIKSISKVRYHLSRVCIKIVWSLWRHRQSIVALLAECKASEWDTGMMCEDPRFLASFMVLLCHVRNKVMYVLLWQTVYELSWVLFWCLFPSLLRNSGNKHQNNTLVSLLNRNHIFQSMVKISCVEFQRYPLKFHKKTTYPYIEGRVFHSEVKI